MFPKNTVANISPSAVLVYQKFVRWVRFYDMNFLFINFTSRSQKKHFRRRKELITFGPNITGTKLSIPTAVSKITEIDWLRKTEASHLNWLQWSVKFRQGIMVCGCLSAEGLGILPFKIFAFTKCSKGMSFRRFYPSLRLCNMLYDLIYQKLDEETWH